MTLELDKLERLRAAATQGPYRVQERGCTVCGYDVKPLEVGMRGMFDLPADAEYICALLTAAPVLIAAARERDALEAQAKATESGIFELLDDEVITMSRARELLGEKSMLPVRERYKVWRKSRRELDAALTQHRGEADRGRDR